MTSAEIRQSFLDFFARQGHTIVPSSSLLPDSPGLLFTNAGMNQFVPIFLGDRAPDVSKWAGARPAKDTRAADTQKCIRAGGKHNDLEDVGFDTYHHTMFEMLGNWSFGDYFKKESITWGWELITKVWGIPAKRLFATVYSPDKSKNDPSDFDQEAYDIWAGVFKKEGLDPAVHIVHGNKKDNFWMMGDTGPCGPCSEIHFNLLPSDDEVEGRKLVNAGVPRCIEIWNHVFIQFNANADGTFSPLAAKHVDTGMGFERVAGIYATTKGFKDFSRDPSNYNADVFAPLFAKIEELSKKTYNGTVPTRREGLGEQENIDIAFRVLADHARCVSCAIADNILPGNEGRNYVIRRILRRGILYGKKLNLATGFFEQLVAPVVESLGAVFPELKERQDIIRRVIRSEEESFGRTLEKGLQLFNEGAKLLLDAHPIKGQADVPGVGTITNIGGVTRFLGGKFVFRLYDTYGFPVDMTQLLATERGLAVNMVEFASEMQQQQDRSRAAQKKEVIVAATEGDNTEAAQPTKFIGYDRLTADAQVLDVVKTDKDLFLVFDQTPFYAEMGGQTGDHGVVKIDGQTFAILATVKDKAGRFLHKLAPACAADVARLNPVGKKAALGVSPLARRAISRHHSAEHLVHWALRKTLGTHVRQAGTSKTKERMRFDFTHFEALTPEQIAEVERLVNSKILSNDKVEAYETEFDKKPEGTLAFFGEKYGKIVRVVDIGGYSRELCGGTHVSTTSEIGLFKIVAEMAIAAGTRRLEAVAGQAAYDFVEEHETALKAVTHKLNAGPQDVAQKLDSLLAHQKELEKKLKAYEQKAAAGLADELAAKATARDGLKFVTATVSIDNQDALRSLGSQVLHKLGEGVVTLGAALGDRASLVVYCSPAAIKAGHQAGKIVGELSTKIGGKGGGKPDFAMGGGKDPSKLADVLKQSAPGVICSW
ncbi:alanine--tRNA ligase [Opitutus terrae]|uniref:Alanine--tRNA ligase n=1 Tax=Opitutus terrae (strain DSM 11246 / JCM 15787 / PB90-1) TaxID=452637 RepID=SYA_OPITP|nr:alanine--tRNA ligase [Opitutus terrae]B1ZZ40.1 RecName: Full=Alanine--tRNA ligase; AltName: Full=Alanyl-tRNA synthetase; Short=AlaRS [Opitutus terrae PB90-1]ACB77112.1 alanyl-tRNA synthetase [Opitutus terrae PB90-1]